MKTSNPYGLDIRTEYNALQRARRLIRFTAKLGTSLFVLLVGSALGGLIAEGADWFIVVAISAWGCWGLHHLLTRH